MDRRKFLKDSMAVAAMVAAAPVLRAGTKGELLEEDSYDGSEQDLADDEEPADGSEEKLITSAPMLQNFATTSIGIAFAVSSNANGFVKIADNPGMNGARLVKCGGYRVTDMNSDAMLVRVTGLKPSTRYWYTIGADRISYDGAYKMKITGTEEDPGIYSFTTAGKGTKAHFCVINDTHSKWETFAALTDRISEMGPSCVVWNGDTINFAETIDILKNAFLQPPVERKDYASRTPFLFCPGNHDRRGLAARHIEKVWMPRQNEERSPLHWDLYRNFAVRVGEVALIGLDTAEDKLDTNPLYAGLFNSGPYREAQAQWLAEALKHKDIASAPFKVAFCHIPLFDSDPDHNPGDIAPDDKDPRYKTDYAMWQRTCGRLWGPLLSKAGCRLVISGHTHIWRYDAPDGDRKWGQLVGGSPRINDSERPATIIEGVVEGGELVVRLYRLSTGEVLQEVRFEK